MHLRASMGQRLALVASLAAVCAVSLAAHVVVPGFERMFAPYAAELAPGTRIVFATYRWWPVLLLAVAAAYLSAADPSRGSRSALVIGLGGSLALACLGWWALQAPELMLELIEASAP